MKEYTVVRRPEVLNWAEIPAVSMDELLHPTQAQVTARAQVCYDDEYLYIRLCATEQDIRAEYTGLLDEVCEDSCLEFFFCPIPGDNRYLNMECNPNGAMYVGMGTGVDNLIRLVFAERAPFVPQIQRTEDGWEVVHAIPYTFIRQFFPEFAPAPGYSIRANFYKCGDLTPNPHYLMWNAVPPAPCASFHQPEYFGKLIFA